MRYVVVFCVAMSIMLSATFIKSDEVQPFSYEDVSTSDWYFEAVNSLCSLGVLPTDTPFFYGNAPASRGDIVYYFHNLMKTYAKDEVLVSGAVPFGDVNESDHRYEAIGWAYHNGIVKGYSEWVFNPEGQCTREELCTIAMRYLTYAGIKPRIVGNTEPFHDSLKIRSFARSYVISAKLAGVIEGDSEGYLRPFDAITRAELAKMLYAMYNISLSPCPEGEEFVDTTDGAYTPYYAEYSKKLNKNTVNVSAGEAYVNGGSSVSASYFDDAAFVGDSVSMSLQYYCASSKALGNATFLCAGSLSPLNAHWEISSESKHPVYKGEKLTVEDAVARSGAKKIYIMLGINSLSFGVGRCVDDTVLLIDKILEKSPDVKIILQSVTPMTKTSPIMTSKLNNDVIRAYNQCMLEFAQQRGWYYINVAEAVADSEGNLRQDYCSDPNSMGIHFNFEADKAWVDYLKAHAPGI